MNTQIIPKKIQNFINDIPENGAVQVTKDSWDGDNNKAIGKINGRLEFFEYEIDNTNINKNEPAFNTCWIWNYESNPKEYISYFELDNMPKKTGKIFENTFL